MKLHVFNPEHDIVMAYGDGMFTSPHAARGLRRDLGFIPAFTAEDGDFVLVDDIESALESLRHVRNMRRMLYLSHPTISVTCVLAVLTVYR